MKKIYNILIVIAVLVTMSYAEEASYFDKEKNSWLQAYSNQIQAQSLDDERQRHEIYIKEARRENNIELRQL